MIDFGCSEGKLISQLKKVECVEELVGIDLDHETLDFNKTRARPFSGDYLDPRPNPLTVGLYQGKIQYYGIKKHFIDLKYLVWAELVKCDRY